MHANPVKINLHKDNTHNVYSWEKLEMLEKQGKSNLSYVDLSIRDLSNVDLSFVELKNVELRNVDLQ